MSKIKVSELFYSLQGEGRFVGVPSVFLRTFGCNFICGGFGMPKGEISDEREFVDPKQFRLYEELPLTKTGCDSYPSWDPRFKDFSPLIEVNGLVDKMTGLTPNNLWEQNNGNDVHLVITGGEPLLGWQRSYIELLSHDKMQDLQNLTFETNGTQLLHNDFREYLFQEWTRFGRDREYLTFSVSPKLSASGEKWSDAIKPEVIMDYQSIGHTYLKFVVDNEEHFEEVVKATDEYRKSGFGGKVYVMPVGGVSSLYDLNKFNVAEAALKMGYNYSPRLHVDIWGNAWAK
jgi:organic radical activating enzyme